MSIFIIIENISKKRSRNSMDYLTILEFLAIIRSLFRNDINKFEEEFAEYIGVKYALGTSYGRTAIYLALKAMGAKGKDVMVPAFTCSVVRDAIILSGAKPIFIDIDVNTLDMKLADIKKKLKKETSAIILIHYYGQPCNNIEEITRFAKENNIVVIEDCAHSLGAEYKGKKVGDFGDMAVFSLTKNALNFGGGVLCTNNNFFYEKAKDILEKSNRTALQQLVDLYGLMSYGYKTTVDKVVFDRINKSIFKWWLIRVPDIFPGVILKGLLSLRYGFKKKETQNNGFYNVGRDKLQELDRLPPVRLNLKMHPMVASVGLIQLRKIDEMNDKRIGICKRLNEKLNSYYFENIGDEHSKNVCTNFPMKFQNKNIHEIREKCKKRGLLLRSTWPAFQEWWEEQDTENVRAIRDNLLMLMVSPMLTDGEIDKASKIIREVLVE